METYQASELTLGMLGSVQKGDTVIFGLYSHSPGTAWVPMEWEVLRNEEGKLLLLSAYCIEAKPFHKAEAEAAADILFGRGEKITWAKSTLRKWLNQEFWYGAFQKEERAMIAPVKHSEEEDGEDKVFCLSWGEAHELISGPGRGLCKSAPFTEGADTSIRAAHSMEIELSRRWDRGWWLRTVRGRSTAYCVVYDWAMESIKDTYLTDCQGVRPALWFDPKGGHPTDFDTAYPRPEEADVATLKADDLLSFGTYERGDGTAPITWEVLEVDGDRALLITKQGIDCKPFHEERAKITWEDCTLRTWLNGEFFSTAFSDGERARILPTELDNGGLPSTRDSVFLLSMDEVKKYYGGEIFGTRGHTSPTDYAVQRGAYKHHDSNTSWWLRTPSCSYEDHTMIFHLTSLLQGGDRVDCSEWVVRPVIWVSLKR
ncbi:MAG: hypothetical protein J6R89_04745 [Clostridia bacterium]|nr:hypothetical protein [Clostridia bacterium]